MIIEDQGGHGTAGAGAGRQRPVADAANQDPASVQRLRHLQHQDAAHLRRHRPRPRPRSWACPTATCSTPCRPISARPTSTTSTCSATPSRSTPRPTRPSATTSRRSTELQTRSTSGAMVPLGSVVTLRHTTGPYRVLRYNLYPAAEIQGDAAPGHSTRPGAWRPWSAGAPRRLPHGLRLRMDRARLPAEARRQHRHAGLRAWRWCSSSCCWPRSTRA